MGRRTWSPGRRCARTRVPVRVGDDGADHDRGAAAGQARVQADRVPAAGRGWGNVMSAADRDELPRNPAGGRAADRGEAGRDTNVTGDVVRGDTGRVHGRDGG